MTNEEKLHAALSALVSHHQVQLGLEGAWDGPFTKAVALLKELKNQKEVEPTGFAYNVWQRPHMEPVKIKKELTSLQRAASVTIHLFKIGALDAAAIYDLENALNAEKTDVGEHLL